MAKHKSKTNWYNTQVITISALGSFTFGYCTAIIATTIGQPGWFAYFDFPLVGQLGYSSKTTPAIGTCNGLYSAGGAIGALFIMWSADFFGRKVNIQIGGFITVLGGALQAGAANFSMFLAGRFVCGLGVGILLTVCPMYMSEMSPPAARGWQVGHHPIFLVFGYVASNWIGYGCYFAPSHLSQFAWRFPLAVQCIAPILLLAGSPWLPRSPRWLMSKGRAQEAWNNLSKLRRSPEDPEDLVAKEEFYQMREQLNLEARVRADLNQSVWIAVWKKPSYRKRMIIGFMTQWGVQFAGPLVIYNYSTILYSSLGIQGHMVLLLGAVYATLSGVFYNPISAWLHDKLNSRRSMFLVGLVGCLFSVTLLAELTAVYGGGPNKVANGFAVFAIFFYCVWEGGPLDTTIYLYISEIFPMEIRSIGMGFSIFGQFAGSLVLLQTAPIGFEQVGWKYYLVLICSIAVFIPYVYYQFPETACLSLEEISQQFGDEVAVHVTDATNDQREKLDDFLKGNDFNNLDDEGIIFVREPEVVPVSKDKV